MTVFDIISDLSKTRSSKDKIGILQANADNKELTRYFYLALNPYINFYQKKKFDVGTVGPTEATSLSYCMDQLENIIAKRVVTGNAAIEFINDLLESTTQETGKVLCSILQKDPDCGVGTTIVNKIWPNLIPEYPCLLATEYTEKLGVKLNWNNGVISQVKEDSLRVNLHIDNGVVTAFTRSGRELNVHGQFDVIGLRSEEAAGAFVIDGELMTIDLNTGKFNPRTITNGICSKAIKGTMSVEESKTLHIVAWDIIPLDKFRGRKCDTPYYVRLLSLANTIKILGCDHLISLVESKVVHSMYEANKHYEECRSKGLEGTIIKDMSMIWEDARSKLQLKLKAKHTADLRVIGYNEGEGVLTGNLGSLICETGDSECTVAISGFSLKLRSQIYANLIAAPVTYTVTENNVSTEHTVLPGESSISIDSIVEVFYNTIVKDKSTGKASLFLPRFSCERLDKTTPNNLVDLKV